MTKIYQIKITLKYIRPPIWRRIQVPADTRLGKLHDILQITMGWSDSHLHQFIVGREYYGVPDPHFPGSTRSERNVRLDQVANEGDTILYEYDFGDGWAHALKIEKTLPVQAGTRYPVCLAGKRACPPEDCGGVPGYEHMLEILSDPRHEEYEEMCEWLGGEFDLEVFDVKGVNEGLRKIR